MHWNRPDTRFIPNWVTLRPKEISQILALTAERNLALGATCRHLSAAWSRTPPIFGTTQDCGGFCLGGYLQHPIFKLLTSVLQIWLTTSLCSVPAHVLL